MVLQYFKKLEALESDFQLLQEAFLVPHPFQFARTGKMRSKEFLKRISAQASVLILRQRKKMENYISANIFDQNNI